MFILSKKKNQVAYHFNCNIYQYLILLHVNCEVIHHVCKLSEKPYLCSQLGEKPVSRIKLNVNNLLERTRL